MKKAANAVTIKTILDVNFYTSEMLVLEYLVLMLQYRISGLLARASSFEFFSAPSRI